MARARGKSSRPMPWSAISGLALLSLSLLLLLAFFPAEYGQFPENHILSKLGIWLAEFFFNGTLGRIWSFVLPLLLAEWGLRLLLDKPELLSFGRAWRQLLFAAAGALSTAALLNISSLHETIAGGGWWSGTLPTLFVAWLVEVAGAIGAFIFVLTLVLVSLVLVFHWHPGRSLAALLERLSAFRDTLATRLGDWRRQRRLARLEKKKQKEAEDRARRLAASQQRQEEAQRKAEEKLRKPDLLQPEEEEEDSFDEVEEPDAPAAPPVKANEPGNGAAGEAVEGDEPEEFDVTDEVIEQEKRFKAKSKVRGYRPPSVDLLNNPPEDEYHVTEEDMKLYSELLVNCLRDFNLETKVVHVHPGPVITRYDLEPAPGVKVSRIAGLADDLALKLKAERIRIIAPVPGKGAVGVELPNKVRNTVFIKSIVNTEKFSLAESPLTVALGKTSQGEAAVADLRAMPHILVAGQTGSGKSVCVNGIICSILLRAHPSEVQFVLIDPKMIELSDYRRIADQFIARMDGIDGEVVTDPQDAVKVLAALEVEMDNRYRYLSQTGYRSIQEFNEALESGEVARRLKSGDLKFPDRPEDDPVPDRMVYLVVIIDELADLMMTAGKEIETSIARLAQKARAVGIHLVVATQRPSVDVLTGLIKANFPARIAFAVRQKVDSKTIIDSMGADQLLGKGDMLYLASGSPEPVRMHNALISGKEIRALLDHIRRQPRDQAVFRLPVIQPEGGAAAGGSAADDERDDLFWDAAEQVVLSRQGSVSVLQRRLRIGHSRASRLIDQLEVAGIVGPFDGSKARQVLVDEQQLEEMRWES